MTSHYRFPLSTELNRRLPKEVLYQRLNPTAALRQLFVTQVQEINWSHKLSSDTLNMTAGGDYPELQVFDIELKIGISELDEQVLRAIDGQIVHPIFFRIHRRVGEQHQIQYQLAYKAPAVVGSDKAKIGDYFASEWLSMPEPDSLVALPVALDVTQLYRILLQGLTPHPPRSEEPLRDWIIRLDELAKLDKRISRLQSQLQKEKQFNRKIEMNAQLRKLIGEMEILTH